MLEARSRFPAVAVEVTEAATRKTASDRQHLHTAGIAGEKGVKCQRLFRPKFSKVKTSFFPEIRQVLNTLTLSEDVSDTPFNQIVIVSQSWFRQWPEFPMAVQVVPGNLSMQYC